MKSMIENLESFNPFPESLGAYIKAEPYRLTEEEQAIAYRLVGQLHLRALLAEARDMLAKEGAELEVAMWLSGEDLLKRIDAELNR